jgi:ribosomal protein L40E
VEEQAVSGEHCRACGAALAPDAEWCSLCFTSTAPEQPPAPEPGHVIVEPEDAPPPPVVAGPPVVRAFEQRSVEADTSAWVQTALAIDTATSVSLTADGPTWPCLTCNHPNEFAAKACAECGAPFLASAKEAPRLKLPVLGDVFQLTKNQQIGAFTGLGLLLVAVLLGVMAILAEFI